MTDVTGCAPTRCGVVSLAALASASPRAADPLCGSPGFQVHRPWCTPNPIPTRPPPHVPTCPTTSLLRPPMCQPSRALFAAQRLRRMVPIRLGASLLKCSALTDTSTPSQRDEVGHAGSPPSESRDIVLAHALRLAAFRGVEKRTEDGLFDSSWAASLQWGAADVSLLGGRSGGMCTDCRRSIVV